MASLSSTELKKLSQEERVTALGMRTEQLTGRSMFIEFDEDAEERFTYPWAPDVDYNKRTEIDTGDMTETEVNSEIRSLMEQGYGTIVIKDPRGKHSLGVGILNRLNLIFEGSLGYFGVGLIDGTNVRINGRVGWSCGENMMSGTIHVKGNTSQSAGATAHGGNIIIDGDASSRCGISMKGVNIIVKGSVGHMSAFMAQAGTLMICGDAGEALGDSIYETVIYLAGKPKSLGVDCIEKKVTKNDLKMQPNEPKLKTYGLGGAQEGPEHPSEYWLA